MERSVHRVGVVIPAGGRGLRLGTKTPKQLLLLGGEPILQRAIQRFELLRSVHEIVVAAPAEHRRRIEHLIRRGGFRKVSGIVAGGDERQDSVWNGLNAFTVSPAIVLVHDGVRPLVSSRTIDDVIRAARRYKAAVAGVRVKDTIKREGNPGFCSTTLDRDTLWAIQTPQGFLFDILIEAHRRAQADGFLGTDEASLVERLNIPVKVVEGDFRNIKITTPFDLTLAKFMLKSWKSSAGR